MKTINHLYCLLLAIVLGGCAGEQKEEWTALFNGRDLTGWQANENSGSFKVVDGILVANGLRSHLFYVGEGTTPVTFKNFELTFEAMTHQLANSGVYFHTEYQNDGWLNTGYELQVNSSHRGAGGYKEVKKGGSLYGVRNLYKAYTKDSVWYTYNLRVAGNHIQIKIDDQVVVDYKEPPALSNPENKKVLSRGAFALQGHDPESTVYFKNIRVKRLSDEIASTIVPVDQRYSKILDYQANHIAFIDYQINTSGSFNIDSALQSFFKTGINLGLVVEANEVAKGRQGQLFADHIKKYRHLPAFLGLITNNNTLPKDLAETSIANFDYIIGDITRFKNKTGDEVDILMEKNIGDNEVFMEEYVEFITDQLDKGGLNIWAMASILPESLSGQYDKLWTQSRMLKVIEAAKRNDVAIEVYLPKKIPSIAFIKLAKEKGCLFTMGGLFRENEMSEPVYFYELIDSCKLDYKDIYIPGNPN
jgi:hypothetical protein